MSRMIDRIRLCIVFTSMLLWGYGCGQGASFHEIPTSNPASSTDPTAGGQSADAVNGAAADGSTAQDGAQANAATGANGTTSSA